MVPGTLGPIEAGDKNDLRRTHSSAPQGRISRAGDEAIHVRVGRGVGTPLPLRSTNCPDFEEADLDYGPAAGCLTQQAPSRSTVVREGLPPAGRPGGAIA